MNIWQPIETAPKDGTRILLLTDVIESTCIREGFWQRGMCGDGFAWKPWLGAVRRTTTETLFPTHWMLKPLPPTVSEDILLKIEAEFVQHMVSLGWTPPPTP